jgi:hypothetical protein
MQRSPLSDHRTKKEENMKKVMAVFVVAMLTFGFAVETRASSGGIPIEFPPKKQEKKPSGTVKPQKAQPQSSVSRQKPATTTPVAQPVPDDLKRRRALLERKRGLLNNTEWDVAMNPLSGKGKTLKDIIVFSEGKVLARSLLEEGFTPTNYSLHLKDTGAVVWETMQTKGEEVVFFKGELPANMDTMNGVISFQRLEGPQNYSFSSTEKKALTPESE